MDLLRIMPETFAISLGGLSGTCKGIVPDYPVPIKKADAPHTRNLWDAPAEV
jgi:hypothetical protein